VNFLNNIPTPFKLFTECPILLALFMPSTIKKLFKDQQLPENKETSSCDKISSHLFAKTLKKKFLSRSLLIIPFHLPFARQQRLLPVNMARHGAFFAPHSHNKRRDEKKLNLNMA
jgi:hypothetical protein